MAARKNNRVAILDAGAQYGKVSDIIAFIVYIYVYYIYFFILYVYHFFFCLSVYCSH